MSFRYLPLLLLILAAPVAAQVTRCTDGFAGPYPCRNVDLLARLPFEAMPHPATGAVATDGNTGWGWTDPDTGREYAIMGLDIGAAFVDVTEPTAPIYLGMVPAQTAPSLWREFKVARNHVFIVSEAVGHGMQVFDLRRLRNVPTPPAVFTPDVVYFGIGRAHNVFANDEAGFVYVVGARFDPAVQAQPCNAGLHMVDVRDPRNPTFAGCFGDVGYIHDTQCIVYDGPDARYEGREICFAANGVTTDPALNSLAIVDVTDKAAPVLLSQAVYPLIAYTHQGWLTEDRRYFLINDEFDEIRFGINTRTVIMNVADLTAPTFHGEYLAETRSVAHNLYIRGIHAFLSNYTAGLRVLDLTEIDAPALVEVAFFDTFPEGDPTTFNGSWNNYPYFESGTVVVSDMDRGLFLVRPRLMDDDVVLPPVEGAFELQGPFPNPVREQSRMVLRVADAQRVRVDVRDAVGRRVAVLLDQDLPAGAPVTIQLGANASASGVYILRIRGERFETTRRFTLIR